MKPCPFTGQNEPSSPLLHSWNRRYAVLPVRLHPIVMVALHTGCRQGELLRLQWRDVDFGSGTFLVREAKSGESRRVMMNSRVQTVLVGLTGRENSGGPIFANVLGKPMDGGGFRKEFGEAVKRAGLEPFRFHDLCHTFASRLAMSGANDRTLQALLGHKSQTMILRYAHLGPTHLWNAVEGLTKNGIGTGTKTGTEKVKV